MKRTAWLAAGMLVLGAAWSVLPAVAGNPSITNPPRSGAKAAKAVKPAKDWGGAMPLPVDQRIERQNSPQDKLLVEVTHSVKVGSDYVAYVKIVWGDLDNDIKGTGKQYYSNWDGGLDILDATGAVDQEIQFEDGSKVKAATKAAVKTTTKTKPAAKPNAGNKPPAGPRNGSGRDEVEVRAGTEVEWKSGVVGVLDGLRIKITSPTADIQATLKAGKFVIPINITGGAGAPPVTVTPPKSGTTNSTTGTVLQLK